jgi:hypothetical protein
MRRSLMLVATSVTAALFAGGCATLIEGTTHSVMVGSIPTQANVMVHRATTAGMGVQVAMAVTPTTLELAKDHEYVVTISKAGHRVVRVPVLHDGVEGWYYGNLIWGIGFLVDLIDGAIYDMQPATINVMLEMAAIPGREDGDLYAMVRSTYSDGTVWSVAVPMVRSCTR